MQVGYSEAGIALTSFFICTTCLTMAITPVYTSSPERSSSAVGCKQPLLSVHPFLILDLFDHGCDIRSVYFFLFTLVTTVGIGGFSGGPVRVETVLVYPQIKQNEPCEGEKSICIDFLSGS